MWFALSLLSAFGQALGWALKKKTLENRGVNNTLGAVAYLVSGLSLVLLYFVTNGSVLPSLSPRFWSAVSIVILTNVLASWTAYRALDRAPLSLLMPFMPLSTLGVIPMEYFVRHVVLNEAQLAGAVLLVVGAVVFSYKQMPDRSTCKAVGYFLVSLLCYVVANPYMAVAVEESQSALLSAAAFAFGISIGFLALLVLTREKTALRDIIASGEGIRVFGLMILSGLVISLLDNGPATTAMMTASASEVISVKRTMPFFALVLGVLMFNEKVTKKHIFGTFLLVTGSILIVWFRQ